MHVLMKNKDLLERYNEIWEKVSNIILKKLIVNLCYKKYLKAEKKFKTNKSRQKNALNIFIYQ